MEKRDRYRDYIPPVFPPDIVISMKLPYSDFIFTAEIWAIIKTYFIGLTFVSTSLEHPLIGMVIRKCVFLKCVNKGICQYIHVGGDEKAYSAASVVHS